MLHKSDAGWVRGGLGTEAEVCDAGEAMMAPASHLSSGKVSGFLVQNQVAALREIFVGARVDKDFGPVIAAGAGGVQVQLYKDVAARLASADEGAARQALASTQMAELPGGLRGLPVAGTGARVARAVSQFIADFADDLSEVGVNPLAAMPRGQGCGALDWVVVRRQDKGRVS